MSEMLPVMIPILVILIMLSAFFSSSETALTASSRIKLKVEQEDGSRAANRALNLIGGYDKTLIALLIGNNIVNILTASLSTVIFTELIGPAGVGIATAVITVLVIIFGEVLPKSFANQMPEKLLKFASPILLALRFVFWPAIILLMALRGLAQKLVQDDKGRSNVMTEDELRVIIEEIEDEGGIEEQQSDILQSALQFANKLVGDVTTHRVDLVALPIDADGELCKNTFLQERFTRLPVYKNSIDEIVGVVNQKEFFAALLSGNEVSLSAIMQKPLYVPPRMPLPELLRLFEREKTHIAVVVDSFGGTEGIVTHEDVLEELVGEIWDEFDEVLREIHTEPDGSLRMSGDTPLCDLYEFLDLKIPKNIDDISVAAHILDELGIIPENGQKVPGDTFEFTVLEVAEQRILKVEARYIAE